MGQFDINAVNSLLELYSDAVEYYNSRTDKKYLLYQNRMHRLMVQPDVMIVMSGQESLDQT